MTGVFGWIHLQIKDASESGNLLYCKESLVIVRVSASYHRCTEVLSLEWMPQSHIPLEENSQNFTTWKHVAVRNCQKNIHVLLLFLHAANSISPPSQIHLITCLSKHWKVGDMINKIKAPANTAVLCCESFSEVITVNYVLWDWRCVYKLHITGMTIVAAYCRSMNADLFLYRAKLAAVMAFTTLDSQRDISL